MAQSDPPSPSFTLHAAAGNVEVLLRSVISGERWRVVLAAEMRRTSLAPWTSSTTEDVLSLR
jgi:hypothetical protein